MPVNDPLGAEPGAQRRLRNTRRCLCSFERGCGRNTEIFRIETSFCLREENCSFLLKWQRRHQTSCWRYCLSDAANTNHTDVLYLFIGNEMSVTVKLDFEVPSQEALNLELHWIYMHISFYNSHNK